MMRYPILEICARIEGHDTQHRILRDCCRDFDAWQPLLSQAELQSMAPLLQKHLLESGADVPPAVRRSLFVLYKRHQKQARVRLSVLEDILQLLSHHHLTPILIKGAALSLTLYPDPALRPMRDIDILFRRNEADKAQDVMRKAGFEQSTAPIPPDHYHLPSLYKNIEDCKICLELHRGLYPGCPPYYPTIDFGKLLETGHKIQVGKRDAVIFNHEETLHYLYQHGFRPPLSFETYKLVHAADLIGFTEKYAETIDWHLVKTRYAGLYRSLVLLHHIAPWNPGRVPEHFKNATKRQPNLIPAPFKGWPQKRMKAFKSEQSRSTMIKDTFWPSTWWLSMYYGTGYSILRRLKARVLDHPRNVLWWARLYSHFIPDTAEAADPGPLSPGKKIGRIMQKLLSNK